MSKRILRREFLSRAAAAAFSAPLVLPASALGMAQRPSPSNRITLAAIGLGGRGQYDLGHFLVEKDVQCVAVGDCFADRRTSGKALVDRHYGNQDCKATRFHEEILGRSDIDAVLVATGDRWHAVLSMLAARAGKDVYTEKPFCLTIAEGRALVETTKRYGTIWQCGTQRRSNASYRSVVEVVQSGLIGKLRSIRTSFGGWGGNGFPKPEPEPDPEVFDYDRWLGQAPWAPYSKIRVDLWRNTWDTSGGPIVDMGPHFLETAQWAHNSEMSGPVEFQGTGEFPEDGLANIPFVVKVTARYADGVRIEMDSDEKAVRFDGDEGWIRVDDMGGLSAEPKSILQARRAVSGVGYTYMAGHIRNFLDCVKSRQLTASHPEIAHRVHTIAHCANICLRLGRKVCWDPDHERFLGDDDANRMLSRTMRAPWRV
jgi:predicted dehydrogenase